MAGTPTPESTITGGLTSILNAGVEGAFTGLLQVTELFSIGSILGFADLIFGTGGGKA